jgi:hypothetical protein
MLQSIKAAKRCRINREARKRRRTKKDDSYYIHTTYGSIVYQRNILEICKYTKHSDKMQMIDSIKQAQQSSEGVIAMFNEQIVNNIVNSEGTNHSVVSSSTSNAIASAPSYFQFQIVKILVIVIVLSMPMRLQKSAQKNENPTKNSNNRSINYDDDYYRHEQERKNTIANPYYPNTDIHRRILDIPFSMIILDGIEVGLELVNSNNPKEF